jgi:nucleotide-binding universal stress UspA family protein
MLRENSGNAMRFKTMCFKTLLHPLHDCHLIVQLFGESLPVPPMFAGNVGAAEVWAQRMSKRESQLQDRARALSEQLQKTGVSAEVRTSLGDGIDLVAMGAYGHSRLKERIFGGTTIEMLEQCQLPLLMVH